VGLIFRVLGKSTYSHFQNFPFTLIINEFFSLGEGSIGSWIRTLDSYQGL